MNRSSSLNALLAVPLLLGSAMVANAQLPGAIFTTTSDGSVVNGNTKYATKCGATGVWLDGGPPINAPQDAAGLPDGEYYFQVTDPSGKTLLSTDKVNNRCVEIKDGIIIGNCGSPAPGPGTHNLNNSVDAGGGKVVELCPFLDTPNNGGVYKAWMTPAANFVGNAELVDNGYSAGYFHGFIPATSKTDNFKVKDTRTYCIDAHKDIRDDKGGVTPGVGWIIRITEPSGVTNDFATGANGNIQRVCHLTAGTYTVSEVLKPGSTVVETTVDGVAQTPTTSVNVTFKQGDPNGKTIVVKFVNTPCSKCE